jgi:phenylacetic acid degradation operon negative regulatory protein
LSVSETDEDQLVQLPRSQTGSKPQHLLVTLLGDFFWNASEHIPSASLVTLLGEFGVTSAGSRAALSRLSRRGLLSGARNGRHTSYRLTPQALVLLADGVQRVLEFGTTSRPWSGSWSLVAFSVPEDRRQLRPLLRTRLRSSGFAPLYDGLWISPRPPTDDLGMILEGLGIEASTVFVVEQKSRVGGKPPISAWDLDEVQDVYREFIEEFTAMRRRVLAGDVGAAEGLVARTRIMDRWRAMPAIDPELPTELLPPNWPREAARDVFVDVYDGLGALAELRVRQIVGAFSSSLAEAVSHWSTSERIAR